MTTPELAVILSKNGVENAIAPNNELAVNCLLCGDTKLHARISVKLGWVHCHRKGCNQRLSSYLRSLKINVKLQRDWVKTSGPIDKLEGLFNGHENHKTENISVDLSEVAEEFSDSKMSMMALSYLASRGIGPAEVDLYHIMLGKGTQTGRVVIPFTENGDVVYYQARAFLVPAYKKVTNPNLADVSHGKSEWLYNADLARQYKTVVITEGWASAISSGTNAVAIQGNQASVAQLDKLTSWWRRFVICLDAGMEGETCKLAAQIKDRDPYAQIRVVWLDHGDPNDFRSVMRHLIDAAPQYNWLEGMARCLKLS